MVCLYSIDGSWKISDWGRAISMRRSCIVVGLSFHLWSVNPWGGRLSICSQGKLWCRLGCWRWLSIVDRIVAIPLSSIFHRERTCKICRILNIDNKIFHRSDYLINERTNHWSIILQRWPLVHVWFPWAAGMLPVISSSLRIGKWLNLVHPHWATDLNRFRCAQRSQICHHHTKCSSWNCIYPPNP